MHEVLLSVHLYYYYSPQNSAFALNCFGILVSTFQSIYRINIRFTALVTFNFGGEKKKVFPSLIHSLTFYYLLKACHVLKDKR